jgi:hypothetical protein
MKKKWYGIIALVIIAALICSSLALLLIPKEEKEEWKVYENKDWGFTIKYPVDWDIKAEENEKLNLFNFGIKKFGVKKSNAFYWIWAFLHIRIASITLDERVKEWISFKQSLEEKEKQYKIEKLEVSNATVNGVPAKLVKIIVEDYGFRSLSFNYFILNKGKEYDIILAVRPPEEHDKYAKIFDEMINSFEFI